MRANHLPKQPIGIFDSGIGGLTVTHALIQALPHEHCIYFGDTAHLPYGDKSTAVIQAYSIKITEMLLEKGCKLILIACNSASAAAYEAVKEYVSNRALVMNVIDPVVDLIKAKYAGKRVGLIGTRQTVSSRVFEKKINAAHADIQLASHATNLLAQAIEEFGPHPLIDHLLNEYLSGPQLQHIDALVLACTHYPVIKDQIAAFYDNQVDIIDASEIVAHAVKRQLQESHLQNEATAISNRHFYISDYTASFAKHAKLFFGEAITLEQYPLWD
jgi:glutamate racemase